MTPGQSASWDGRNGTAGGAAFGAALLALVREREFETVAFAAATDNDPAVLDEIFAGGRRVTVAELARLSQVLRIRAIEFLQKTQLLSLHVYALGLDPLYFLPPGMARKDARIYMREINPRHRVPERDMLVRNPTLKALLADTVLDDLGKLEVELAYLLRAAVQHTGGTL